jgi:hypothetical protein
MPVAQSFTTMHTPFGKAAVAQSSPAFKPRLVFSSALRASDRAPLQYGKSSAMKVRLCSIIAVLYGVISQKRQLSTNG